MKFSCSQSTETGTVTGFVPATGNDADEATATEQKLRQQLPALKAVAGVGTPAGSTVSPATASEGMPEASEARPSAAAQEQQQPQPSVRQDEPAASLRQAGIVQAGGQDISAADVPDAETCPRDGSPLILATGKSEH